MNKTDKPPEVDHFLIHCEALAPDVGPIIAVLTRMGVRNIGYELKTDIPVFAGNRSHAIKAEDFLAAWIVDHPTFKAIDAVRHFREDHRTDGAAYSALRVLVDKGTLKKPSSGNYARADVRALESPKAPAKAAKQPKAVEHDRSGREEIERFIRNRKSFSVMQLRELFRGQRRNEASVSPILDKLLEGKAIKRIGATGSGEYATVKRSAAKQKKSTKPKKSAAGPRLNGGSPVLEVGNG
ncbi:hypothetical protein QA640_32480 [Bradyrhizobium sp. CB82]|uniref:hypothetical protein n=1 Tax=Bradyrhizobium sp. CB82 TaxID=3039159 RepID=UPI0024B155D7|nr:hypothetical protein [Bradyrhizobium sp. CB82]WFU39076.1 hypothetical protein QA640_32480 [Bradyrhizobium sp. CB82]